jgi:hypothetical protein
LTKVLVMKFLDSEGKMFNFRVIEPAEGISSEDVRDCMQLLIDKDVLRRKLVAIDSAYIITTAEQQIVFGA